MGRLDLYDMVTVERTGDRSPGQWAFRGRPVLGPYGRVFGGQLLGQAVAAATASVEEADPERRVHSMHASFLSIGDSTRTIDYEVAHVRDGRSFSVRSVQARQDGRLLLTATASFQSPAEGLTHETPRADGYPDPESLDGNEGAFAATVPLDGRPAHRTAVDIRRVPAALDPRGAARSAGQAVWLRAASPRGDVPESAARAVLVMATDFTVLESAVAAHGLTFTEPGLEVASLDHAMWWHASAALDEWVLYVQESPWAGGQRALITGRVYARDGRLLASMAQEGLIRLRAAHHERPRSAEVSA
jgi:acyl-CoA thioesterase-2